MDLNIIVGTRFGARPNASAQRAISEKHDFIFPDWYQGIQEMKTDNATNNFRKFCLLRLG